MQRLKIFYDQTVVPKLVEEFGYQSSKYVPRIKKIIISRGLDESCQNSKVLESLSLELTEISGQQCYLTRSKKAISNFKVKQGVPLGLCITLRRSKMYSFFDRLVNLALPRIRDFQGFSSVGFDGSGNFSFGLSDQLMFPEVDFDKVKKVKGMNIVLVTTAKTNNEAFYLLKLLGFPFR